MITFDSIKSNLDGEFRAYRPATGSYGRIAYGATEACQIAPFDAADLQIACAYARHLFGTGSFAVRRLRHETTGTFRD